MAGNNKQPRRLRREVLDRFEQGFDFERLDYERRIRPLRGKSILFGVSLAGLIYFAGFGLGFYAWQQQAVSYDLFARLVWILMLPATVIGAFTWLLHSQRSIYRIRQDIRVYIAKRESKGGFLWRFAPLIEVVLPDDGMSKRLLQESQDQPEALDPEDYGRTITTLRRILNTDVQRLLNADVAARVHEQLLQ